MNFLQLLASGASILNFNFQSKASQSVQSLFKPVPKNQGFQKVGQASTQINTANTTSTSTGGDQALLLNQILQNQRQELINRYLQLNLQLLQGQINKQINPLQKQKNFEQIDLSHQKDENQHIQKVQNSKKKIKKAVKCGHEDKGHYAKGLCNNCYHKYGRTKKPWNCPHEKLYAGGMCQNCYINMYNKKKREQTAVNEQHMEIATLMKQETIIISQEKHEQKQFGVREQVSKQFKQ